MAKQKIFSRQQEAIIMNFFGIPREEGDFMSKDPVTMEALVGQFIDRHGLDQPGLRPEQVLVEAWESIFGSFSQRCFPVKLSESGVLIISVSNATLRSEIRFMKREILKKIQKLEACEGIVDMVIRG